jgi:probable F420-dependent oxidoreductase
MPPCASNALAAAGSAPSAPTAAAMQMILTPRAKAGHGIRSDPRRATVTTCQSLGMSPAPPQLGRFGIWRRHQEGHEPAREIERLGYSAIWVGGTPSVPDDVRPYLDSTSTITVLSGIANVWKQEPPAVAAGHAELRDAFGERFLLGIGIGHPEATAEYKSPLAKMREFLDGLDAGARPVPRDQRLVAAIGPKMIELAGQRSLGTHPYFTTVEHTRFARERVGPDGLVAPEVAVVIDPDPESGRAKARDYAAHYLTLTNYTRNLLSFGFSEQDLADGGSDRLIDAVIPHGSAAKVAEAAHAHLDAGADHVCLQPSGGDDVEDYRALAAALGLT